MKTILLATSAIALIATSSPALAQEAGAEGGTGAEIIVTAQKREENLQDVPLAVSVIGSGARAGFTLSTSRCAIDCPSSNET